MIFLCLSKEYPYYDANDDGFLTKKYNHSDVQIMLIPGSMQCLGLLLLAPRLRHLLALVGLRVVARRGLGAARWLSCSWLRLARAPPRLAAELDGCHFLKDGVVGADVIAVVLVAVLGLVGAIAVLGGRLHLVAFGALDDLVLLHRIGVHVALGTRGGGLGYLKLRRNATLGVLGDLDGLLGARAFFLGDLGNLLRRNGALVVLVARVRVVLGDGLDRPFRRIGGPVTVVTA